MQQVDTLQPVPKVSTIFNRVIHFFAGSRVSIPPPDQVISNIDWPDSDPNSDPMPHYHERNEQPWWI
jgi:hypothetical protein